MVKNEDYLELLDKYNNLLKRDKEMSKEIEKQSKKIKEAIKIIEGIDFFDITSIKFNQKSINKAYDILYKVIEGEKQMNSFKKFEEKQCNKCKNNNKENINKCEIIESRIDGHLFCKGFEKLDNIK